MAELERTIIATENAPGAIGPYSQAVKTDTMIFVSGQLPLDPDSGDLITGDIEAQTRQALINVKQILDAAGSGLHKVVKATVYIKNMDDFPRINAVYGEFFTEAPPARACVEVARLPKDANIEIDAIALL